MPGYSAIEEAEEAEEAGLTPWPEIEKKGLWRYLWKQSLWPMLFFAVLLEGARFIMAPGRYLSTPPAFMTFFVEACFVVNFASALVVWWLNGRQSRRG